MVKRGFDISKKYLEEKFRKGFMTREELNKRIKELIKNYQTGIARREMALTGMKDYMEF